MQQDLLAVAFWLAIPAFLITVVLLVRQSQISNRLRDRISALEGELDTRDHEAAHLITARLPALTDYASNRSVEVPGPLNPRLVAETSYGRSLESAASMFADSVETAMVTADRSAKTTLKAMMRTVQSLANEQQLTISVMQDRHDDPNVLEDLLKIDHMNSQFARRAQATAVLCGSWPGAQRSASSLTDVVRGATSRIRDYLRVQVNTPVDTAVVSRAVEPVVLAVAEVLDNGARHSQPNTSVEITFQPAHNGMAVVVDDAGVGMNAEELRHAEAYLSGRETVDINRLGDPPQVGFPVIGVLAARYGFSVSVDTRSPYGGVRAVVFLPTALLTRVNAQPTPQRARATPVAPEPVPAPEPAPTPEPVPNPLPMPNDSQQPPESTSSGLPKRRRRQRVEPPPEGVRAVDPAAEEFPATEEFPPASLPGQTASIATSMGAWQRGTLSGRVNNPPDYEGNSEG